MWQEEKRSRRVWRVSERGLAREARGRYWRCVATRGARAREAGTSAGACDTVSGRSLLGFARNWLFCHFMPLLWRLDEQNDDI